MSREPTVLRGGRHAKKGAGRGLGIAIVICVVVLLIVIIGFAAIKVFNIDLFGNDDKTNTDDNSQQDSNTNTQEQVEPEGPTDDEIIAQADLLATQYDYDGAIALLQEIEGYETNTELQAKTAEYQNTKNSCSAYPLDKVTHVFFHTLIKDNSKAFDGDYDEAGYNQVMTTISEFNGIIQQMYDKGYVMVSLHDMYGVNEDGTVYKKDIMLPSGKIPFVLSQDDVSYYHYMDGDGFAQKLIIDENGEVKNTYIEDDGSISVGDYDMVPLIDTFVKEHPDFAYHGHKGIVALTGYEGVLGYRTDEVYRTREAGRVTNDQQKFFDENPDFDWQKDVDDATAVANAMKANGWEFASHTWGHINPLKAGIDSVKRDTQRWADNVATIVGQTDVLFFAFGADINDWHPYTSDNEYFTYLKSMGYNCFCNVDSNQYWVQFGDNYMRQGRRNLDGYRMYYNPEKLSDLFDVDSVFDPDRPTPVPPM